MPLPFPPDNESAASLGGCIKRDPPKPNKNEAVIKQRQPENNKTSGEKRRNMTASIREPLRKPTVHQRNQERFAGH